MSKIPFLSINGKPMGVVGIGKINRVQRCKGKRNLSPLVPLLVVEEITDIAHVEGAWVKKETDVPNS